MKEYEPIVLTEDNFPALGELRKLLGKNEPPVRSPPAPKGFMTFTVAGNNGFKFEIYPTEHPPPHFHVSYRGESASFSIDTCELIDGGNNLRRKQKSIKAWHTNNKSLLIEKWNELRPDDCPVGKIET